MNQQSLDLNSAAEAELGFIPLDDVAPTRYVVRISPNSQENQILGTVEISIYIKKQNLSKVAVNARLISIKEVYFRSTDGDTVLKNPFVNFDDEIVTIDFSPDVLKVCPNHNNQLFIETCINACCFIH